MTLIPESLDTMLDAAARAFAAKELEQAEEILSSLVRDYPLNPLVLASLSHARAVIAMEQGDLSVARALACQSIVHYRVTAEPKGLARAIEDLGTIQMYQGRLWIARSTFRRSLQLSIASGDAVGVARGFERLGQVTTRFGEHGPALQYLGWALTLRLISGAKPRAIADLFDSFGAVMVKKTCPLRAIGMHRMALHLRQGCDDELAVAKTLSFLGVALRRAREYAGALRAHQAAMRIRRRFRDRVGMANCHNNIGLVFLLCGRYRGARKHLRKALLIRTALGDAENVRRNLSNLARLRKRMVKQRAQR